MPASDDDAHDAPSGGRRPASGATPPGKLAPRLWLTTPAGLEDLAKQAEDVRTQLSSPPVERPLFSWVSARCPYGLNSDGPKITKKMGSMLTQLSLHAALVAIGQPRLLHVLIVPLLPLLGSK